MPESAADFQQRQDWFEAWNAPREGWRDRGPGEVAFTLEAVGVSPDGFEQILRMVDGMRGGVVPAALRGVAPGFRFGIYPVSDSMRIGGEPIGVYCDAVILAWPESVR